jgi:hypothetical protein
MAPTRLRVTATSSWSIYRWGWQFSGSEGLDEAYVPFFGHAISLPAWFPRQSCSISASG